METGGINFHILPCIKYFQKKVKILSSKITNIKTLVLEQYGYGMRGNC